MSGLRKSSYAHNPQHKDVEELEEDRKIKPKVMSNISEKKHGDQVMCTQTDHFEVTISNAFLFQNMSTKIYSSFDTKNS